MELIFSIKEQLMINTVSFLLYASEHHFSLAWNAPNVAVNNQEITARLKQQSGYMPKVFFLQKGILSVECSPAKCLYGNNIYEVSSSDFNRFIAVLRDKLCQVGVFSSTAVLSKAHCWRVDYAKEIFFPWPSNMIMDFLRNTSVHGRMQQSLTLYPQQGKAVCRSLKHRKIMFYDKGREFLADKTANSNLINIVDKLKGSLWRYEISLKTAKEVRRELKRNGYPENVSMDFLFDENKAKYILKSRFQQIKPGFCDYNPDAFLQSLQTMVTNCGVKTSKKLIYTMAVLLLVQVLGFSSVYEIIVQYAGKRAAQQLKKELRCLSLSSSCQKDRFVDLTEHTLNEMKPLTLPELNSFPQKSFLGILCLNAPVLLAILQKHIGTLAEKLGGFLL